MKERVELWCCPECREIGDPFDGHCLVHSQFCSQPAPVLEWFIRSPDAER